MAAGTNWGDDDREQFFSDAEIAEVEEYARTHSKRGQTLRAAKKKAKEDAARLEAWRLKNPDVAMKRSFAPQVKATNKRLKAEMKAAIKRDKKAGGKGKAKVWVQYKEDGKGIEQKWGTYDEWKETDAYKRHKQKSDFKLGDPEAWKSTENQWLANRSERNTQSYLSGKMRAKYSPANKDYDAERDREKFLYYQGVNNRIADVGFTSREDLYRNRMEKEDAFNKNQMEERMNKGEQASMDNAYEPSLFSVQNGFNTQASRDVGGAKKGIVGNEKAGNAVYNPKSNTRKAVTKMIKSRGQKLTASRKAQQLDRSTERMF